MFVYVNGYGLRPFRAVEISMFNNDINNLQFKGKYKLPKNSTATDGKKWVDLDYWFRVDQIVSKQEKINTVLFKDSENISCHTVGVNGCINIVETPCAYTNVPCFSYSAKYLDGKEVQINNVILATDQKLS